LYGFLLPYVSRIQVVTLENRLYNPSFVKKKHNLIDKKA